MSRRRQSRRPEREIPMSSCENFFRRIRANDFDFFTGVPDSTFKKFFLFLEQDASVAYIPAVREDLAVGLGVGAYYGGRRVMVLMQNSGLGTSLNALVSLPVLYKTPMLMLIGWRGHDGNDAPEHIVTGRRTPDLLRDIGVPYLIAESEPADVVDQAVQTMEQHRIPTAILLREGILT
jgi:sulfopyruvate decarboxylase subunit alpha